MIERSDSELEQTESVRRIILETINVAYKGGVKSLKFLRHAVEDAETMEELLVAKDMMQVVSRFYEAGYRPEENQDGQRPPSRHRRTRRENRHDPGRMQGGDA